MCVVQRSVAQISQPLAAELGVEFKDDNGNYIISLQLAAELESDEFTVIPGNYSQDDFKGILPLNPRKPILRPKP